MTPRFHCLEEMDYLGQNKEGHWFECKLCGERECTLDINAPITPDEIARPSMLEYRLGGKIPKFN